MDKQEFLEKLRQALSGRVTPGEVTDNLKFYEDYINVEIRKGRSEDEVLAQLGDPRLIARTIVETSGENHAQKSGRDTGFGRGSSRSYYERRSGEDADPVTRRVRIPGWMVLLLLLVAVVLVLSFVFSVVTALLPIILPVLAVIFLVKLFRDWLN